PRWPFVGVFVPAMMVLLGVMFAEFRLFQMIWKNTSDPDETFGPMIVRPAGALATTGCDDLLHIATPWDEMAANTAVFRLIFYFGVVLATTWRTIRAKRALKASEAAAQREAAAAREDAAAAREETKTAREHTATAREDAATVREQGRATVRALTVSVHALTASRAEAEAAR
ncbi:unnamed protein product, partial [Ectocarpus sp. 12 AP-2014]